MNNTRRFYNCVPIGTLVLVCNVCTAPAQHIKTSKTKLVNLTVLKKKYNLLNLKKRSFLKKITDCHVI